MGETGKAAVVYMYEEKRGGRGPYVGSGSI